MHIPKVLPDDFQAKLNLAWVVSSRTVNHSVNRRSSSGENLVVPFIKVRKQEIRVIQDIEKLRPELDVEALRHPMDGVVLEEGEVKVERGGPDYRIPPGIAEELLAAIGRDCVGSTGWWADTVRTSSGLKRWKPGQPGQCSSSC